MGDSEGQVRDAVRSTREHSRGNIGEQQNGLPTATVLGTEFENEGHL